MSRGVIIEPDENGLYGGVVIYGPDGITPISSTNPLNVSLTGSKPTSSGVFFSALAITDTTGHTSSTITVTGYDKKVIGFINTLNQSVTVTVYGTNMAGTTKAIGTSQTIPTSSGGFIGAFINSVNLPGLQEPMKSIYVVAQCTIAPTSGSLNMDIGMQA